MTPKSAMIYIMANVIGASDDYDGDRLNDPAVWGAIHADRSHPDGELSP